MRHKTLHPPTKQTAFKWRWLGSIFLLLSMSMLFPAVSSAQHLAVPQELLDEIQQSYTARVIIGLKVETPLEGALSGPAAEEDKRTKINGAQDQFLADLGKALFDFGGISGIDGLNAEDAPPMKAVVKFTTVPYLVLENVDSWTLSKIKENSQVSSVELDVIVPPILSQSVPLIGANNAWTKGYSGTEQAVAVLDTGVDKTHSAFSGSKVISEACYSSNNSTYGSTTVCPNNSQAQVGSGAGKACNSSIRGCDHGTHVAGIVAGNSSTVRGVAKDAKIVAIQVFSRFNSQSICGSGGAPCALSFTSDQIRGLERVLAVHKSGTKIAAVNMSLGGNKYTSTCDGINSSTKAAIDNLRSVGIATLIASGNNGYTNAISSPACISSGISVGATDKSDNVASYSNSASILDLLAPGSDINSSIPGGNTASWNGTSMATPHVAGAWAVLKSAVPTATVNQILTCLKQTGKAVKDSRNSITKPRIQVDDALTCLLPPPNISISPTSLDFGNVNIGATSSTQIFTISNTGKGDLKIGGITLANANDFKIQSNTCSNQTIAPSKTCTIQVVFTPKSSGLKASSISISSNDPDTKTLTATVKGNGVGIPNISVNPKSYDFGKVNVGSSSKTQTFIISNTGSANLVIKSAL